MSFMARQSAHVHLSETSIDFFARIYLQCRGGLLPAAPMIVSWNDSAVDPSRAPAGKALMKFVVLSVPYVITGDATGRVPARTDRKSTRLNSSHSQISYAVFCLKKTRQTLRLHASNQLAHLASA